MFGIVLAALFGLVFLVTVVHIGRSPRVVWHDGLVIGTTARRASDRGVRHVARSRFTGSQVGDCGSRRAAVAALLSAVPQ